MLENYSDSDKGIKNIDNNDRADQYWKHAKDAITYANKSLNTIDTNVG